VALEQELTAAWLRLRRRRGGAVPKLVEATVRRLAKHWFKGHLTAIGIIEPAGRRYQVDPGHYAEVERFEDLRSLPFPHSDRRRARTPRSERIPSTASVVYTLELWDLGIETSDARLDAPADKPVAGHRRLIPQPGTGHQI
jgi:hypothetical protein